MSFLEVENLHKTYQGSPEPALCSLSLSVDEGEILALVGESGSGKTTTARIIAGFEVANQGRVSLDGQVLWQRGHYVPPERRRIGVVFQDNTLFPHLTVEENIRFGLPRAERRRPEETAGHLARLVEMTGLAGFESRYPHELSGGQMQRVAIARALAPRPRLLLLDEPFNNLDVSLKDRVVTDVAVILKEAGISAILVTHSPREAFAVADRLAVIRNGSIGQAGPPQELYRRPADRTVAEFFGPVNELPAWREGGRWLTAAGPVSEDLVVPVEAGTRVFLRPEYLALSRDAGAPGRVRKVTFFGDHYEVVVAAEGLREPLVVRSAVPPEVEVGERIGVGITAGDELPASPGETDREGRAGGDAHLDLAGELVGEHVDEMKTE